MFDYKINKKFKTTDFRKKLIRILKYFKHSVDHLIILEIKQEK